MNKPPSWLKRGVLVCHLPTSTVFTPEHLHDRAGTQILTDPAGQEWKLSECELLQREHLRKGGTFANASGITIAIYPDPRGLILSDGCKRQLLRLGVTDGLAAARSLASAFDGAIYSEEVNLDDW